MLVSFQNKPRSFAHPLLAATVVFICSCKTIVATSTSSPASQLAAGPSSCKISGQILTVSTAYDSDTSSICARYPCMATVIVTDVQACGAGASFSLSSGDTVLMRFLHTLASTAIATPGVKPIHPGLIKGDHFIAIVEQRLKANAPSLTIATDYELINTRK